MKQFFRIPIPAVKLLGVLTALALVFSASLSVDAATTWTVTKTADTNDGACDSDCSLREAIAVAAQRRHHHFRFQPQRQDDHRGQYPDPQQERDN